MGSTVGAKSSFVWTTFTHLRLLLWKNFLIQWRHPIASLVELLLPCLLIFIISFLRGSVEITTFSNATIYESFPLTKVDKGLFPKHQTFTIMYTSNGSDQHKKIVDETANRLTEALVESDIKFTTLPFKDTSSMEKYYLTTMGKVLCGVEFVELTKNQINFKLRFSSVPKKYESSNIRHTWETIHIMPEVIAPGPRENKSNDGGLPGYEREGFLLVQHELTLAAAKVLQGAPVKDDQFQFEGLRFPFYPYVSDIFLFAMSFLFPAVVVFSFIYGSVNLTKAVVIEKEMKLKEVCKMHGLNEAHHWTAMFIKTVLLTLPSIAVLVTLLCIKLKHDMAILNFSNPFVLFLFFFLYEISNICLCFMISTFFSKANLAGIATGIIFFFSFLPFFTVVAQYSTVSAALKIALLLLPNTNMAMGVYIITMKESRAVGIDWSNIAEPALPGDNLNILLILGFKLINSVIYLLVTWYVTQAFPGEFGVGLPWYFPFTLSYWRGEKESVDLNGFPTKNGIKSEGTQENIERDPSHLRAGIRIMNLSKSYNGKSFSVDNLNLNIYHGQICCLLGHNGAGKTTTISMLTGLYKPSSGTAIVNGYDIRTGMNSIRSSLGICPQYNVLFDELTVEEHLQFYCKLKRPEMDAKEIKEEIKTMLEKLDLVDKQKVQSSKLSGGMKRKLCVGISLCAGSSIVILDEPSSGMDVSARRFIWDLLLKEKEHRSILITTHFMEEADVLGDRIAIMANGKLQCCGSPLFLKKQYGTGYSLTIAKRHEKVEADEITKRIQRHVESANMESAVGLELTYSLPDDKTDRFESLLSDLEANKDITNYGISVTTMEEVFLKVGEYSKDKIESINNAEQREQELVERGGDDARSGKSPVKKNYGLVLLGQQLYALLLKKLLYAMRSPFLTAAQLLIPFIILNMTQLSLKAIPRQKEAPPLHMELTQFRNPQITYFYDQSLAELATSYAAAVRPHLPGGSSKLVAINSTNPKVIGQNVLSKPVSVYSYEYMISAVLQRNTTSNVITLTSFFNNQAFHTPSIALKYVDEAYIRYVYGLNDSPFDITVTNLPLPLQTRDNLKMSVLTAQTQFQVMQGLIMAIAFLIGSFAVLAVKERVNKGKHLQGLSGVRSSLYWMSYFLVDYFIYLASSALIIITFVIYKENGLYEENQPYYLLLGFVIHGFAILPFVYAMSFMFDAPATAYARLCLYAAVLGIAAILTDQITSLKQLDLLDKNRILKPIFSLLIPVYDLGKLASNMIQNYETNKVCGLELVQLLCKDTSTSSIVKPCCKDICEDECLPYEPNFLSLNEPGIGSNLLYLVASATIYMTILILLENSFFHYVSSLWEQSIQSLVQMIKSGKNHELAGLELDVTDDDVELEKKRVDGMDPKQCKDTNPLIVRRLKKRYGTFTAVKGISYTVQRGTCFGMLGVNGAGKTSTFKMITGDENISGGDIFVNGINVKKNLRRAQQDLGFCNQFDTPLLEDLTGREMMTFYSRLRGIRESEIPGQIDELSRLLYFEMHLDKRVDAYSGGNKRRLSTAISFLGNPPIAMLDEPSSGVDPVARRCLWTAISTKLKEGVSIVLTSHSMDECSSLCNQLIIMVNGQIYCIGSPLQLMKKFGNGYTVLIRVASTNNSTDNLGTAVAVEDAESVTRRSSSSTTIQRSASIHRLKANLNAVQSFMRDSFGSNCSLKARHNNLLHYSIENTDIREVQCSQIFGAIERAKHSLQIEDYSVCQTNLEQIFLSFARRQRDEDSKSNKDDYRTPTSNGAQH